MVIQKIMNILNNLAISFDGQNIFHHEEEERKPK